MEIPIVNNLQFKRVDYRVSMGKTYAFVTCVDVQSHGHAKNEKKYWGEVMFMNDPDDILNVMEYGSHWDYLP